MKCPHCAEATLVMSERQGIEIDYCPQCRGVWLDRGELDKLIERAVSPAQAQQPQSTLQQRRPDFVDSDHGRSGGHYKKRKSWLGEIFD
ncbi:MAG: zf-TFIIB domain-containing protein [Hydrogenophaga sp.]|jgi:Zn-finger nucleic acid-binding protein|uniref:TFIIB-type zinc ribbon-containing protein n=1 Tax=Hydrogenophaga sp. TaxID=1904254 RepID=UPI001D8AEBDA|nr:zf-TFIIB domain-containing protein [Hydrogenophaga sp.]MBW0170222.1 zf-TFIIB domain-containing protein [Hydrogenophaga sp.]MBW0182380.1 zf-TFIIB domain-containing protein [Hydrogenophaga sp.]